MKGDAYIELMEALNNALYIGKYVTNYKSKYKKDKKRIEKMLKDVEHGKLLKYMEHPEELEDL